MKDIEEQNILEMVQQIGAAAPLASLIDEIVLESFIDDYSLRTPAPIEKLMQNEDYIRNVLGIAIPLNESYPYSPALQEKILEEQLLFEGFFEDAKELAGNMKKIALALRYVFEDGSRIKSFMSEIYNAVIKNPMEKLISIIKKIKDTVLSKAKEYAAKGWDAIDDYLGKFADMLEKTWETVKSSAGWKGAMLAVGLGAAVSYIWVNHEKIWETLQGMIDKLVDFGKKKKKEEAIFVIPALGRLLLSENDNQINEYLNEAEDEEEDEEKTMVQKILEFIKSKIIDAFGNAIQGLATDALMGAVSGGVSSAIKTLGKAFGGAKFVAKILAAAAEPFISKIENPEQEMEEMEQGEDDPTEAAWHDNEKLIREFVREKLLAAS